MITVERIHTSAVKSLRLVLAKTVHVDYKGIIEDRRLYVIDDKGELLTQRQVPLLGRISSEYELEPEKLRLTFSDGNILEGPLELGESVNTKFWWRYVPGQLVTGDWNQAISQFCHKPIRLVMSDEPGDCQDEYPISLMAQASVKKLSEHPDATAPIDSRRFRPTFLLDGCEPNEEDTWMDQEVQIGNDLRLTVVAKDPRCVLTTQNPDTGERDVDTQRLILSYRPGRKAYFGVYGVVQTPGTVSVGDTLKVLVGAAAGSSG